LSELWKDKHEIIVPYRNGCTRQDIISANILRLKKAFVEEKMKQCMQEAGLCDIRRGANEDHDEYNVL
jgi:DNA primase